ncbi:DUF1015 family protein [Kineococcus sp. SYSU DK005]|uniref:DUF1015 family protein n=1 Tax=Kineococcus sp. SYSU DK005 TaxID=3383126 RepID=UPI003D7D4558
MEPGRTRTRAPGSASPVPAGPGRGRGALVLPFPGLRYREEVVGPLDAVMAPPHTELDKHERERALAVAPYLVTHLERPEYAGTRTDGVPAVLRWVERGALVQDPPALYVLQQQHAGRTHRFLLGELQVGPGADDRVLPHEATIEDAVVSRAARLRAVAVDSEPVLLVDAGTAHASTRNHEGRALADAAGTPERLGDHVLRARGQRVSVDVWRLEEPTLVAALCAAVGARRWIIGDGHHRWAAVRRTVLGPHPGAVLAAFHLPGSTPLDVLALHRLAPSGAAARLLAAPDVVLEHTGPVRQAPDLLAGLREPRALVLHEGTASVLRTPGNTQDATGTAAWVDHTLVEAGIADDSIRYVSDTERAVTGAVNGTAVLLSAPRWEDIAASTTGGRLMGRKATSYRPKPLAGAVLRLR